MYQYLNIKTSNIWWHTFLQHGNPSLGSFLRFCYFQTLGSTAPTLPWLRRLLGELRLPPVCCATASDGQR
jgi:hypothetical protein